MGLIQLINEFFLPLAVTKTMSEPSSTKRGQHKPLFEFDELVNLLLRGKIGMVLYEIYKLYFKHELKTSGDLVNVGKESQKALYVFLKEFDICPELVAKAAVFNMLVDDANSTPLYTPTGLAIVAKQPGNEQVKTSKLPTIIGRYFTFFKFLDLLVQVAVNAFSDPLFSKNLAQPMLTVEMVILVLERMELSPGFTQIEKKTNRTHAATATLLPSRALARQIQTVKDSLYEQLQEQPITTKRPYTSPVKKSEKPVRRMSPEKSRQLPPTET